MSWIKENYHIAALGGGALVLAGLGYLGYSGNQTVNTAFTVPNPAPGKTTTSAGGPLAEEVTKLVSGLDPIIHRKTPTGRPVEMFTSVNLYTKDGNKKELLDLLQMDPVHDPIDNQWWVDNRIDPSYSDSPSRDEDGDGFSNLEEFNSKTDPNDPTDYEGLIGKLEVVKVESDTWRLIFQTVVTAGFQFQFDFIPSDKSGMRSNRIPAGTTVKVGDLFFPEEPAKERFKLLKVEERPFAGPVGQQMLRWAIVEDQLPTKDKKAYELPFSPKANQMRDVTFYDHRVFFRLNAIGEEGNEFKVEENGSFALPSGGEDKSFKLIEVVLDEATRKPVAVKVEDKDGKPHTIPVPAE